MTEIESNPETLNGEYWAGEMGTKWLANPATRFSYILCLATNSDGTLTFCQPFLSFVSDT